MSPSPDSAQLCPLCGGDNDCALARGGDVALCWCFVTPLDRTALQQANDQAVTDRCLCIRCGRAIDRDESTTQQPGVCDA